MTLALTLLGSVLSYVVLPTVIQIIKNRTQPPLSPPAPSPVVPGPSPMMPAPVGPTRPVLDLIHALLTKIDNPAIQIADKELQVLREVLDLLGVKPLISAPVLVPTEAK